METKDTDYNNYFSEEEIKIMAKNALKTENFKLKEYTLKAASDEPMGFLGVHVKVHIKAEIENDEKEFFFFVKKIPSDIPSHLEYALATRAFYKEIELYKTLFQDIAKVQKDSRCTKWRPEFYYSRNHEILAVEDLSVQGYYLISTRTLLDEDHVRAALKAVAALHAGSFIFEEKFNSGEVDTKSPTFVKVEGKKVEIGEIYEHLTFETEATDDKSHPGNRFYDTGFKAQPAIVDLLPNYTPEEKETIKKKIVDVSRRLLQLVKPSKKYRNIFLHGDLWAHNILFKKQESGTLEAILVDFQLLRYGPPAQDLAFLLYLVQNNEFIKKKEDELIKYYYDNLKTELSISGIDVEKILPWDVLLESYKSYYEFGVLMRAVSFQFIKASSENTSKFLSTPEFYNYSNFVDRREMITDCYIKDEIYRDAINESMNDLIKGFIL